MKNTQRTFKEHMKNVKNKGFLSNTLCGFFFGKYRNPLMTRDLRPPRMDGWTGSGSPRPIVVVI